MRLPYVSHLSILYNVLRKTSIKKRLARPPAYCIACPSQRLLTMPSNAWPHCVNDRNCHCRPAHSSCCKHASLVLLSKNNFHLAPHGREPCHCSIILLSGLDRVAAAFWQCVYHLAALAAHQHVFVRCRCAHILMLARCLQQSCPQPHFT